MVQTNYLTLTLSVGKDGIAVGMRVGLVILSISMSSSSVTLIGLTWLMQ